MSANLPKRGRPPINVFTVRYVCPACAFSHTEKSWYYSRDRYCPRDNMILQPHVVKE